MKTNIKRRCKCGCGQITNPGRKWIYHHHRRNSKQSKEAKHKISLAKMGNTCGRGNKGKIISKETRLKTSLTMMKCDPNYEYCDAWHNRGFKKDLRKDYCEDRDCGGKYKQLGDHHIDLNKKNCHPSNIMTLCTPCHSSLHWKLYHLNNNHIVNHKDYLTIIRKDRITYIHKETKTKTILRR